jgi:FKBP-type peptidyl-prolyl cis-trans isomerase FkpA/FKBP-type peptidyl-prolyl cis-trans isomerase FklB
MKFSLRHTLLAVATAGVLAGSGVAFGQELKTEKDKISYMVGMQIGGSLTQIKDEIDVAVVIQALQSALKGEESKLTQEEAMALQQSFAQKLQGKREAEMAALAGKNKTEGEAFMAKNKSESGVQVTASGLQYKVVNAGSGAKPAATDTVKVHYVGTLLDGTKFDSSVDRGEPAQFALNAVIPGWTEALQLMPVGAKYTLWIPSELAYGDRGTPGPIGPNATLRFEVELLEIVKQ